MHFYIHVEDQSGKKALDILVPMIIGSEHTFEVFPYKGLGHIPKNMKDSKDADKRILLDILPKLLKGFGRTFAGYGDAYAAIVIVVCDLDRRNLKTFRNELLGVLNACSPQPETRFCIAIEEGEAWSLGDLAAVKAAYLKAKDTILDSYVNDSICSTWETLANSVYPGGAAALKALGWSAVGEEKSKWAERIAPRMDVESNNSPSFCYFRDKLQSLAQTPLQGGA